jgi:hypothetical protein
MAIAVDPGRMTPLMLRAGEAADDLLRAGIESAKKLKEDFRKVLLERHPELSAPPPTAVPGAAIVQGRLTFGGPTMQNVISPTSSTDAAASDARVKDPGCVINYEPTTGLTTMLATIKVRASTADMALVLDPRAWSCTGGAIASTFIVDESDEGEYAPSVALKGIPVGTSWNRKERVLLYEYARSEVASFENILAIQDFTVSDSLIRADYQLHDCLIFTLGSLSAPGGLTVNEGYVTAEPVAPASSYATQAASEWWQVEVKKVVRVRDLTPNDPGNPYDFGMWVNSTIGSALGEWVHDARTMSPVF